MQVKTLPLLFTVRGSRICSGKGSTKAQTGPEARTDPHIDNSCLDSKNSWCASDGILTMYFEGLTLLTHRGFTQTQRQLRANSGMSCLLQSLLTVPDNKDLSTCPEASPDNSQTALQRGNLTSTQSKNFFGVSPPELLIPRWCKNVWGLWWELGDCSKLLVYSEGFSTTHQTAWMSLVWFQSEPKASFCPAMAWTIWWTFIHSLPFCLWRQCVCSARWCTTSGWLFVLSPHQTWNKDQSQPAPRSSEMPLTEMFLTTTTQQQPL